MADSLPRRSEVSTAMRWIDEAFGGLEFSSIEVRWSEPIAADAPEVLEAIGQVDDLLRTEPLIGHPLSIRSLLAVLPGEGNPAERMSMVALLPPPLKRAFFVPEDRSATVTFRVRDVGIAQYGPVFERIEAGLDRIGKEHPEFTFHLDGTAAWRWRNLYQIVVDLAMSLGSASVIIFAVLGLAFRSLRIGLISIVPNVFPLAVTGTFLVLAGQSLEVVSVCAFTICLGIAVDDTGRARRSAQQLCSDSACVHRGRNRNDHDDSGARGWICDGRVERYARAAHFRIHGRADPGISAGRRFDLVAGHVAAVRSSTQRRRNCAMISDLFSPIVKSYFRPSSCLLRLATCNSNRLISRTTEFL
jgi:hypothetical protein